MKRVEKPEATRGVESWSGGDISPVPILVLRDDFRVVIANPAFCRTFDVVASEADGVSLFDMGHGRWGGPELRAPLQALLRREMDVVNWEGAYGDGSAGEKTLLITARLVEGTRDEARRIVLTFTDITERKRVEDALRESEKRFQIIARATNDAVWDWDLDSNKVWWNEGIQRLFGYTPDQVGGTATWWVDHIHPEDRERVCTHIHDLIQGCEENWQSEYRYQRADGSYAHVLDRGCVLRDKSGKGVRMIGGMQEVTARKRAEEQLAQIHARSDQERRLYQTILSTTPDLVYVFDLNHRFAYANDALLQMWGKSWAEAAGKNCLELGYEEWHARMHDREIDQVIATKQPIRGEVPFTGTHGRRIYDYIFVPVLGADGEVEAVAGTTRDVTDRKQAEEALRNSTRRFDMVRDATDVGFWFCDLPFEKLIWDNKVKEHFWLPPEAEVSIETFFAQLHPEDRERTRKSIQYSIDNRTSYEIEYRTVSAVHGRQKWIRAIGRTFYSDEGQPIRFDGVTLDITEQKESEVALARAHSQLSNRAVHLEALVEKRTARLNEIIEELEAFSYSIVHDMRAPLRSLQGFGQFLFDEYGDKLDSTGQEYLKRIVTSANRMDRFIQDILSYSRTLQGEWPLENVDVQEILRDILGTYPAVQEAEIKICSPLPCVIGNQAALSQCFSNLLGNAVKFVRPGERPRIQIWAEARGDRVRLFIKDNGIGIAPEHHERIFAIFQRVSKTYDGTGIGLAIVQKAIARMGGQLGLESKLNQGSTFWMELKLADGGGRA